MLPGRARPGRLASLLRNGAGGTTKCVVARGRALARAGRRWKPSGLARLLMAVVLLCGVMHAGRRYFYCEALGLALSDPCAHAAPGHASGECAPSALEPTCPDCCTILVLQAMPDGSAVERAQVPPAPAVATIGAAPAAADAVLRDDRSVRAALGRWRVPPRPPGEARAQLMVFLI